MSSDWYYLLRALENGGCNVGDPHAYTSLTNCGYMVPARIPQTYGYGWLPFGMALTKKGQQRAKQIKASQQEKRENWKSNQDRRGIRGAAWPRRYQDPNRSRYGAATWPKKIKYPMGIEPEK